jgi:hypothetical protein
MHSFATSHSLALWISLAAVFAASACNGGNSGSSGSTAAGGATGTTTTDSSGGSTSGSGGSTAGAGGTGASGGSTSSSGGTGGATTTSTTTTTTTTETSSTGGACGAFEQHYGSTGATDTDLVAGIVVGPNGGTIVAGEFGGNMSVGGQTLASAGGQDAFVVKLFDGGGVQWAKRIGGPYDDRIKGLVPMADGGAVIVGTFDGQVDFGGKSLTSIAGPDAFVARLDPAGAAAWVLQLENADARSVAIGDAGDLIVAGDFTGTTAIGPIMLATAKDDLFVARITQAGDPVAAKQFAFDTKPGVIVVGAGAGRTYLAGSFGGTADFGAPALVSAGSKDIYFVRLTGALDVTFAKRYGDGTSQEARALTVLSDGSAAIAGSFKGTLDMGNGVKLVADTDDDAFAARIDTSGVTVFGLRFGDAAAQQARAIAAGAGDTILVGGGFQGKIDAGDGPVTSAAGEDAFLVQVTKLGMSPKTTRWGGAADQRVLALAFDPCGAVLLGGDFNGSLPIGADTFDATGALDAFVARLAP